MEETLEEVYEKWQSQPATEEQWEEMTREIQQATEKEYEKYNTLKESQPATEEQWEEMIRQIQQATEREYELENNFTSEKTNTPLEDIPEESE